MNGSLCKVLIRIAVQTSLFWSHISAHSQVTHLFVSLATSYNPHWQKHGSFFHSIHQTLLISWNINGKTERAEGRSLSGKFSKRQQIEKTNVIYLACVCSTSTAFGLFLTPNSVQQWSCCERVNLIERSNCAVVQDKYVWALHGCASLSHSSFL